MKTLVHLSLIATLAIAPAGAQEQEQSSETAAPVIEIAVPVAPIIEALTSETDAAVAPDSDAAAETPATASQEAPEEDNSSQEIASESQE